MDTARAYLWIKAWHVIAVIAWFAGLFYVFRLYVYHVQHRNEPQVVATLTLMERRLLHAIMGPAMVIAVGLGATMVVRQPGFLRQGWLQLKLAAVAGLLGYHALAEWVHARFAAGDYVLSERACRIVNEVPTVLLIIIVSAVIAWR